MSITKEKIEYYKVVIGYRCERLIGIVYGLIVIQLSFFNWEKMKFIIDETFLDKIISITTSLFGFLLAILTLIIQSNSSTINRMKKHGGYKRLLLINKRIVVASIINCSFSLLLLITKKIIEIKSLVLLKFVGSINIGIFTFIIIETLIFTMIFYKIIIEDENNASI